MTTTWLLIPILAVMLFGSVALQSYGIKWGLRWLRIADVTVVKAFELWLLFLLADLIAGVGLGVTFLATKSPALLEWVDKFALLFPVVPPTFVIALTYKTKLWRAFVSVLPSIGMGIGVTAFLIFVMRPYLYEAFKIPTNAMAPTLIGIHAQANCTKCGAPWLPKCSRGVRISRG